MNEEDVAYYNMLQRECEISDTMNCYTASQSSRIGPRTERCVICGSPRGGYAPDGYFYCTTHMPKSVEVLS